MQDLYPCLRAVAVGFMLWLAANPVIAGETVYATRFDGPDPLAGWSVPDGVGAKVVDGPSGTKRLLVEIPAEKPGSLLVRVRLPVERMRGARVAFSARVRAEAVAKPPQPWSGVKVMLHANGPSGPLWTNENDVYGSFDERTVGTVADVTADATEAWLMLGLETTAGRAWFGDVRVAVAERPRIRPVRPKASARVYKGHDLPRLRGAMIAPGVTEADLRVLGGEWNANLIRWQLIWSGFPKSPADDGDLTAYDAWIEGALKRLDSLLPACERYGLRVVVDLHTPPGGRDNASVCRLFQEKRFQNRFLSLWEEIARRYRKSKVVWGYDLVNEPVAGIVPEGVMDWRTLALSTARRIRKIDPDHAIIVEPEPWGGPEGFDHFEPLPVKGVVYSFHMYQPHRFTHQGVYDDRVGVVYPGEIDGVRWDKERLRSTMKPAIDFQRDTGCHLYVGEFSAIRWAPGDSAYRYLKDLIDLFEEYGWDWSYHAFREWNGWSVEHGPDKNDNQPSPTPTAREKLLRSWFDKDRKTVESANVRE